MTRTRRFLALADLYRGKANDTTRSYRVESNCSWRGRGVQVKGQTRARRRRPNRLRVRAVTEYPSCNSARRATGSEIPR